METVGRNGVSETSGLNFYILFHLKVLYIYIYIYIYIYSYLLMGCFAISKDHPLVIPLFRTW